MKVHIFITNFFAKCIKIEAVLKNIDHQTLNFNNNISSFLLCLLIQ